MGTSATILLIAAGAVLLAAVFAGAETGIYRLSRLRLRLGVQKKRFGFALLGRTMTDSAGLLLTLLVGTNLAHYVASGAVTRLFLQVVESDHAAEMLTTLTTAPVLFVFSELIPKNLFLHRADTLTPLLAPFLAVAHRLLTWCGAVPVLRFASSAAAKLAGSHTPTRTAIAQTQRHQIRAILEDTKEEGLLSSVQAEMLNRIVGIEQLRLGSVMTPMNRVRKIGVASDRAALLDAIRSDTFTRLLVYDDKASRILGYVNVFDVLAGGESFDNLHRFVRPLAELDIRVRVLDAMNTMCRDQQEMVLVRRGKRGAPAGIVTMKDLVEEVLGELAEW